MNQIVKDLATEHSNGFSTAGAAVGEVNTRFKLTGDALSKLSGQFIKFSQINNTDVSTSVDNVSGVLNAFGQDSSNAGDLLDALNATGQATGIDMGTLASSLQLNAVQLKEMGLNSQQAAGFMGMVEMSGLGYFCCNDGLENSNEECNEGWSDIRPGNCKILRNYEGQWIGDREVTGCLRSFW
jgi:phage-related minor tail protein